MDCDTYIERFLSAHADGELRGEELREAESHVAQCAECRARLEQERALKATLRERVGLVRTPAHLRERIRAALDEEERLEAAERPPVRAPSRLRWKSPRVWLPAAAAALLVLTLLRLRSLPPTPSAPPVAEEAALEPGAIPIFEIAVRHLDRFDRKFEPNVPSGSPADISDAYLSHNMPGYLWNFQPGGYRLVGGRIEKMPDGKTASFTYYKGQNGGILCTYMHAAGALPPGAIHETESHAYYVYKGYSICASKYPRGDFICILVTRRPMPEFIDTIAASSL